METLKRIAKRPLYWFLLAALLFASYGAYSYFAKSKTSPYDLTEVKRGSLSQEVSVTGRVKPAENVDLAFERGGKVASISVKVGQTVSAGQTLASLSNGDLAAQLQQARASLQREQTKLDQLRSGARAEDLQISETAVANAQNSLNEAQNAADTALTNLYDDVSDILNDAYVKADDAVNKQIDELFSDDTTDNPKLTFYTADSQAGNDAQWKRRTATAELAAFRAELDVLPADRASLDAALIKAENHLNQIRDFLTSLSSAVNSASNLNQTTLTSYKYYVNTARTNVTTAITSINTQKQSIASQKSTNAANITAAKNALATAQDQLRLKQAGSDSQDIAAQEAQVRYAQANVDSYAAQLGKTVIHAPISGVVTKQDLKVGQIVNANTTVISVMSTAKFQIEANIPESDIAKVKLEDPAKITLDTYGNSVIFEAKVVEINPAETIQEGVATYKTTFQFVTEDDRIKSGMTANIDILTAHKEGVLIVPQRALVQRGNERFVQLSLGGDSLEERLVTVGLKGSDGNVEILSGLKEGDMIVSFGQTK